MKKIRLIILCVVIVCAAIIGVISITNQKLKEPEEQLKQETKIDNVDDKIDTNNSNEKEDKSKEENKVSEENPNKIEKDEKVENKNESTNKKPNSSVSKVPNQENSMQKEDNNNSNNNKRPQTNQNNTQDKPQNNNQNEQSTTKPSNSATGTSPSTKLYDSITKGRKEFSSESEALARGNQIVENELNYVLDWNEAHPDNQIQPEINYFRIYPVIDEVGTGYYLHFFCTTGEGNDEKLKSKF